MSDAPAENAGGGESPLEHVVDDLAARQDCADWVFAELTKGRVAESIAEELVENGWPADDAADLVEEVRRQTRDARGVVTREAVARDVNRRYRRSMGSSWIAGWPTATAALRLIGALKNFIALKRMKNRKPPEEEPSENG